MIHKPHECNQKLNKYRFHILHNLNSLRTKIGIVFQQFNVFPHLTTLENVTLALKVVLKKTKKEAEEKLN